MRPAFMLRNVAWIALWFCAWAPASVATADLQSDLDALVQRAVAETQAPADAAIAIGIVRNGQVIYLGNFGKRDRDLGVPPTPQTVFGIGSNTKSFTALGLALLEDKPRVAGQLHFWFTRPVRTYLPNFGVIDPRVSKRLTTADLVSHRSGLGRHDHFALCSGLSRDELVARIPLLEMDTRPGFGFRQGLNYNNLMFDAAGKVIESLSGLSWEEYTQQSILDPLGMSATSFGPAGLQSAPEAAKSYDPEGRPLGQTDSSSIGPAGSINSNVVDMLTYLQFYLDEGVTRSGQTLISARELNRLFKRHTKMTESVFGDIGGPLTGAARSTKFYGRGWAVEYDSNRHRVFYHGGSIDGFYSFMSFERSQQLAIVVLNNVRHNPAVTAIGRKLNHYFLHRTESEPGGIPASEPAMVDLPPVDPATLTPAATYHHPGYGDLTLLTNGVAVFMKYGQCGWLTAPTADPAWVLYVPVPRGPSALAYLDWAGLPPVGLPPAIYPLFEPNAPSRFERISSP